MRNYTIIKPDPRLQNNLMAFGFMCGEGWFPLIIETLDKIQAIVDREGLDDFEITEIKEKYGGLRIYTSWYTKEIGSIVQEAEDKSFTICEACGKPGELHTLKGWVMTRCDDCFEGEEK